jgi:hypothetical protein
LHMTFFGSKFPQIEDLGGVCGAEPTNTPHFYPLGGNKT